MKKQVLQIKRIPVNPSIISRLTGPANCIVVWRKDVAVVVDPGGEGSKIARFLKRKKLTVGEYWLTHAHPDHVWGLSELLDEFPAPVRFHREDSLLLKILLPILSVRKGDMFKPFGNSRRIACGDIAAKVILTPGHSPGGVCYWFDEIGVLLSGDTLMKGGEGRTMFLGGDSKALDASIRKLNRKVPDSTKIIPGHGDVTTIGAEYS